MLRRILYLVEALLTVVLILASGMGLFLVISFVVHERFGPEWLTTNALLVFLLGGFLLTIRIMKLLQIVQLNILQIEGEEAEMNEEAVELFEHLRVK
jgi:drug/metabolite transporter (DMT)-like permease